MNFIELLNNTNEHDAHFYIYGQVDTVLCMFRSMDNFRTLSSIKFIQLYFKVSKPFTYLTIYANDKVLHSIVLTMIRFNDKRNDLG